MERFAVLSVGGAADFDIRSAGFQHADFLGEFIHHVGEAAGAAAALGDDHRAQALLRIQDRRLGQLHGAAQAAVVADQAAEAAAFRGVRRRRQRVDDRPARAFAEPALIAQTVEQRAGVGPLQMQLGSHLCGFDAPPVRMLQSFAANQFIDHFLDILHGLRPYTCSGYNCDFSVYNLPVKRPGTPHFQRIIHNSAVYLSFSVL